jgi:hypothetical protein
MTTSGPEARLDGSGTPESDGDLAALHDDRHLPTPAGVHEHLSESAGVSLDIDVANNDVSRCVILTGRCRVRSSVFAENEHDIVHAIPPRGPDAAKSSTHPERIRTIVASIDELRDGSKGAFIRNILDPAVV